MSNASDLKFFVLGATGYIGGSVLHGVRKAYPQAQITALVRSETSVAAVEALGVNVIRGSHSDLPIVSEASAVADVVINAADADDLELAKAVLSGLKKRSESGPSRKPLLLHTSGTGVVSDKPLGEFTKEAEKIWNDNNPDDIRSIDASQPHRAIDLEVFKADEEGYLSAYIIAPSTIYGTGTGPGNRLSQQVPALIRTAVKRRQTVYAGKGTNVWNNVHVVDLVDLYLLVLNLALSGKDTNTSYGKFYFGSVGEHVWGDIARKLAPLLHSKGVVDNANAVSISPKDEPGLLYVSNNSRSASDRGFALGWKPKEKSLEDSLEEDVDATLAKL